LRRSFICGIRAELWVGLDNGRYQIELLWGDRAFAHGPFDVLVQGQSVGKAVTTRRNQFLAQKFMAEVDHEVLQIQIAALDAKANFALAGMTIRGPQQRMKHCVISPPNKDMLTLEQIRALGEPDPRQALRAYCDWLLSHRSADGSFDPNSCE